jgi:hypothetical protein
MKSECRTTAESEPTGDGRLRATDPDQPGAVVVVVSGGSVVDNSRIGDGRIIRPTRRPP